MNLQALFEKYGREVVYGLAQSETITELQEKLKTHSYVKIEMSLEELMSVLYPLRGEKYPMDEDVLEKITGGAVTRI